MFVRDRAATEHLFSNVLRVVLVLVGLFLTEHLLKLLGRIFLLLSLQNISCQMSCYFLLQLLSKIFHAFKDGRDCLS